MTYRSRRLIRGVGWLTLTAALLVLATLSGLEMRLLWLGILGLAWVGLQRWMVQPGSVPILTYHSVSSESGWLPWADGLSLSPEDFARQLDLLERLGCSVITTRQLLESRQAGTPLPRRPVVIHFDDGYLDNWVAAFPHLRQRGLTATIFLSLDFVETGSQLRPTLDEVWTGACRIEDLAWAGYLNWAEIAAMRDSGLIDFQAHGVSHGRVRSGPKTVTRLSRGNWRRHAWLQWAHLPGSKVGWIGWMEPPFVALGSGVPESRSALAVPEWSPDGVEQQEVFEGRVLQELRRCRDEIAAALGTPVELIAWPYGDASAVSLRLASEAGFTVSTGGRGENRPGEDPTVLSRVHAGDRAVGWRWRWLDDLAFCGTVRLGQGSYYWYLLMAPIYLCRKQTLRFLRWRSGRQP